MEALLVWTLAGAAVVALVRVSRAASTLIVAAALVASLAAGHALWAARRADRERAAARIAATLPTPVADGGYVTSNACRACHPQQYASWHASWHRTMTAAATAANVRAPFAGEVLVGDDGRRYRMLRDGDDLVADIDGVGRRRLAMITGAHHMQAFWLPGERGNAAIELPFTWLVDDRRWVSRRDVFLVGSDYSKRPSVWNRICIECHVTNGQPRVDVQTGVPSSRVAELGIACEACHGPAAAHVAANRDPWRRERLHVSGAADDTIVNPKRLPHGRAAEVCGQCHGITCPPDGWLQSGIGYRPGRPLAQRKQLLQLATLHDGSCRQQIDADPSFAPTRYWKDGMVRISGREYNALVASPCFQRGTLTCISCHSMHDSDPNWQLAREGDGNGACAGCHRAEAEHVEAHSHHPAGSPGATCYNCHMPHTTYGLMRAMRSHQISVPRLSDTLVAGRPNACNACHVDRTLLWTAAALNRWYGTPIPSLTVEQRTVAATLVDVARGEAGVRALAAWSLGWPAARAAADVDAMAPVLIELLDDEYSTIRHIAYQSLKQISGFADFQFDYVGSEESRWAAQREARRRWAARAAAGAASWARRPELLYDGTGRFQKGELERLMTERPEDDEMFLAE